MQTRRIAAVVAVLSMVAAWAWAQTSGTNTVSRNGYYFNATTGQKTDMDGNAQTADAFPNRDMSFTLSNIIAAGALAGTSNLAVGAADSSDVLDTRHMRLGMLVIKCVPVGGGVGVLTRLAVQVRTHIGGATDSVSTAAIYLYGQQAPGMNQVAAALASSDTTNVGHFLAGSATAPWSGEFIVTANGTRNAPGNAVAATAFSYPNAICIPLTSLGGREIFSPWTSIRVRNVTGPAAQVYVSLVGTPL